MKEFKGRVVANGTTTAKALVSHGGLNTLASEFHYEKAESGCADDCRRIDRMAEGDGSFG